MLIDFTVGRENLIGFRGNQRWRLVLILAQELPQVLLSLFWPPYGCSGLRQVGRPALDVLAPRLLAQASLSEQLGGRVRAPHLLCRACAVRLAVQIDVDDLWGLHPALILAATVSLSLRLLSLLPVVVVLLALEAKKLPLVLDQAF